MHARQFIMPLFCSVMLVAAGTAWGAPGGYPPPPPPGPHMYGPKPPVPPAPPHVAPKPQPPHMYPAPGPKPPVPPQMKPGPKPPVPLHMRPGPKHHPNDPRVVNEWNWRVKELQRLRSVRPHNPIEAMRLNENILRLERDLQIMRDQYPWLR